MSWQRRLFSFVRFAGLHTADLGGAGQVVSRRKPLVARMPGGLSAVSAQRQPEVLPLERNAWLLQTRKPGHRLGARDLGDGTWLVGPRRAPRRVVRALGRSGAAHLVYEPAAMQADIRLFQQGLGNFLSGEHAAWMMREQRVNCVLDVGANTGQYARALRAAGYEGRIVSFEPLAHLVEELERHSRDDPDWIVVPYALGDADEQAEINVVPGTMSSLLDSSEFGREWSSTLRETSTQTIDVRRLDSVFDEAVAGLEEPRVYLKMDTQGYDVQTFTGAGARLAEVVAMQSEVACVPIYEGMPQMIAQLELYQAAGFSLTGMFPVTIDPRSLRVIEFDAMFIRADAR
ncbi:MAG: hypothetical protein JWR90_2004 [Marmoricola sp.]|jgi:FkbM family methyltransferase|nr:hypothetical protein [Marmoricola sp.]